MYSVEMIDYIGDSDINGKPVGHSMKVLSEYSKMIESTYKLIYTAPKQYLKESNKTGNILPYYAKRSRSGTLGLIINSFNEYRNLCVAWKNIQGDILWFYNIDYILFLFLITKKRANKKIVCTTYVDNSQNQKKWKILVKAILYQLARKRVDCFITSNQDFFCKGIKTYFIPDYFYEPMKYDMFTKQKENYIVCLGTMDEGQKDLENAIKYLNKCNVKVIIKGKFYNDKYYERLKTLRSSNIDIENVYLSGEEYMKLLGKAKFSLLPYRDEAYSFKTSGVLLESIFFNTIPIAPVSVLKKNRVSGIGYKEINELENINFEKIEIANFIVEYEKLKSERYSYRKIKDSVIAALNIKK